MDKSSQSISRITIKEGPFKIDELKPGEMQKWGERWYLACPRCGMALGLDHEVTVYETVMEKRVIISPSIGCPQCNLHIFVRNSMIEYLSDLK